MTPDLAMPVAARPDAQHSGCLVCGGSDTARRFIQRGYAVYRCRTCGFEFVSPTPTSEELAAYYDRSYAVPLERYAAAGARNAARIADLERLCPGRGRLLEFGASYGHSLALARDRGWDVTGVELSPTASGYASTHFGLVVHNCDLADAPLTASSFDAIVGWHVLEHVRNPKDQLLLLARLLKPDGVLALRVPNIASFGARATGEWWPWMCPPAHLWFFSRETLPRLLRECGFAVEEVKTQRGDGNNLYQYALMAAGNGLNNARLRLRPSSGATAHAPAPGGHTAPPGNQTAAPVSSSPARVGPPASAPAAAATAPRQESTGLLQTWLRVLERAQPITNAMARTTRPLLEPIERRGWGDELLVYARRRA